MNKKEISNSLKIFSLKNYYFITGLILLFFGFLFFSITGLVLAIKAEWNIFYIFLIFTSILQILVLKKIFWEFKSYWKIVFDKNILIIERNFIIYKTLKIINLNSEDSLSMYNLKNIKFIEKFPLGKIYYNTISRINKNYWCIIIDNSNKTIIDNLSKNQATEVLNFIESQLNTQ